jgi:hypothetical protein
MAAALPLATRYDAINTAIFLPSGGSRRLRQKLVDALDVGSGQRVLGLNVERQQPAAGHRTQILILRDDQPATTDERDVGLISEVEGQR